MIAWNPNNKVGIWNQILKVGSLTNLRLECLLLKFLFLYLAINKGFTHDFGTLTAMYSKLMIHTDLSIIICM